MCVGQPMRLITCDGLSATAVGVNDPDQQVVRLTLALTGPLTPGTHVLVHLGSAFRVLDATEAQHIADALDAVAAAQAGQPFEHLIQDLIDREPELPAHLQAPTGGTAHHDDRDRGPTRV